MIGLVIAVVISTGAVNPSATKEMVCVSGYTGTVRPPTAFTTPLKRRLMVERHLPGTIKDYELDHFEPIENGGCPRCLDNLWMQPIAEARMKDQDENRIHRLLCAGTITIQEAQQQIQEKWKIH